MVAERVQPNTKVQKWYEAESAQLRDFVQESKRHLLNGVKYKELSLGLSDLISHSFKLRLDSNELIGAPESIRRLLAVAGIDVNEHIRPWSKADPVEAELQLLICTRDQSQQFSVEVKKMYSDSGIRLSILTVGSHDSFDPSLAEAAVEGAEWLKEVIRQRRVE